MISDNWIYRKIKWLEESVLYLLANGGSGGGSVSSIFGRTGAVTAQSGDYTFAQIGSKPTTLSGYGITDAVSSSDTRVTNAILQGGNSLGTSIRIGSSTNNSVFIISNGIDVVQFSGRSMLNPVNSIFSLDMGTSTSPAVISRNTANGYSVFAFNNANGASSGHILDFQNQGVNVSYIANNGGVVAPSFTLTDLNTAPSSATATGTKGEIRFSPGYIYLCTATNTWVRAALATW